MSENIRILSSTSKYQGKIIELVEEEVLLSNGAQTRHVTLLHNGAVVILPQFDDGRLVLVRQYRHSVKKMLLEFPAGSLGKGEDPLDCAAREISEETGFGAHNLIPLGIMHPAPGFCNEIQYTFVAKALYPRKLAADEDEIIEVEIKTVSEVEKAISAGELMDCKSIAIFLKAKIAGLL